MDADALLIGPRVRGGSPRLGRGAWRRRPRFGGRSARGFRRPFLGPLSLGGFFRRIRGYAFPLWVYNGYYYPWWYAYNARMMSEAEYMYYVEAYGVPPVNDPRFLAPGVFVNPASLYSKRLLIATQVPMECQVCGKKESKPQEEEDDPIGLQYCGNCQGALYCGVECQRADWDHHREHECGE